MFWYEINESFIDFNFALANFKQVEIYSSYDNVLSITTPTSLTCSLDFISSELIMSEIPAVLFLAYN